MHASIVQLSRVACLIEDSDSVLARLEPTPTRWFYTDHSKRRAA